MKGKSPMKTLPLMSLLILASVGTVAINPTEVISAPQQQAINNQAVSIPSYEDLFQQIQNRIAELKEKKPTLKPEDFRNFYFDFTFEDIKYNVAIEYGVLAFKIQKMTDSERKELIQSSLNSKPVIIRYNDWDSSKQQISDTKNMLNIFYPLKMKGFSRAGIVLSFDKEHKIECHTKEEPHKIKSPIITKWNVFETSHKTPQDVKLICHENKSATTKE
jgi:hypothetical protein